MTYEESVQYLLSLGRELASPQQASAAKFDLKNITVLCEHLGQPQREFQSVHVAGTNGKGSTSAMLDSILRAAGLRTGLYTSPHLERINERIRVDGKEISDAEFAATFTRVREAIEELLAAGRLAAHPTFFECVTAIAFVYFAEAESGIRRLRSRHGRAPGRDKHSAARSRGHHADRFRPRKLSGPFDRGNRRGKSRNHQAGRARGQRRRTPDRARGDPAALRGTIARFSWKSKTPFSWKTLSLTTAAFRSPRFPTDSGVRIPVALRLPGRFQVRNALTALATARMLAERGAPIDDEAITRGFAAATWPGRLEKINERPEIYVDGTHNPAGAREIAVFWEQFLAGRKIYLIYGAMRDKAVDEIAGLLFPARRRRDSHDARAIPRHLRAAARRNDGASCAARRKLFLIPRKPWRARWNSLLPKMSSSSPALFISLGICAGHSCTRNRVFRTFEVALNGSLLWPW